MAFQLGIYALMWDEVVVPAVGTGGTEMVRVRFAPDEPCVVEVIGADLSLRGEGLDLFEALASVRCDLAARGMVIACNGSRKDVFPSQMLRQASCGRFAYVLTIPRSASRPETVDIFAVPPESAELVSVEEQREWFERWQRSRAKD
jgi:hypothetical protein